MTTNDEPRYGADEQSLLRRVESLSGVKDVDAARRLARAVISVLLEQLSGPDRRWFTRLLPGALVAASPHVPELPRPADGLRDFIDRVAAREAVDPGFAREHTQSVCSALAEMLDDDERARLLARLHDQLAVLFVPPSAASTRPPPGRRLGRRRTLAEGRPGSRKPLSEAAPARAQSESLAVSGNPHAETKLASATGTTQEREGETLSRARPRRP